MCSILFSKRCGNNYINMCKSFSEFNNNLICINLTIIIIPCIPNNMCPFVNAYATIMKSTITSIDSR